MKAVLPFLGHRNYLQGATLLAALLEDVTTDSFTFRIRKPFFSNQVEISDLETDECRAVLTNPMFAKFVSQLPMHEPICRDLFDEEAINASLCVNAGSFFLPRSTYPFIPSVVAVFKHILLKHCQLPTMTDGRHWAFVGLDALKWCGNVFSPLRIENVFCKNGLGRCKCYAENGFAGVLYFAWVNFGA